MLLCCLSQDDCCMQEKLHSLAKDKERESSGRDSYDDPQWGVLYSIHYAAVYFGNVFNPSPLSRF